MRTGLSSGEGRCVLSSCLVWLSIAACAPLALAREPEAVPASAESIQAPEATQPLEGIPVGDLILREMGPGIPHDKGSLYTDGGEGLPPSGANSLERAKLDMARAAVEASQAAGTLLMRPATDTGIVPSPPDLGAIKLECLQSTPPAELPPDPAAGAGISIAPVQEMGPSELTPQEQTKLESGERQGR